MGIIIAKICLLGILDIHHILFSKGYLKLSY